VRSHGRFLIVDSVPKEHTALFGLAVSASTDWMSGLCEARTTAWRYACKPAVLGGSFQLLLGTHHVLHELRSGDYLPVS